MKRFLAVFIGILMVFTFAAAALAASVYAGGTLYFRLEDGIDDVSKVDFYKIDVTIPGRFGPNAYAYLTLEAQTWTNGRFRVQNYGYNYDFNSALGVGIMYDFDGVTLSDGQLASNWDWLHVGAFGGKTLLKVTGRPFKGANVNFYLEPESMEYLVKGEYKGKNFKIGAGYTNTTTLDNPDQFFNVYGEFAPIKGSRVYVDYLSDGTFLLDTSMTFAPITVAVLYSNEDKSQYGDEVFAADTLDLRVTYAISTRNSIAGGVVYDFTGAEIGHVYFEYGFGKGYVGLDQNLPLSQTKLYGGYSIDPKNTLKGAYNLNTGDWYLALAIGLW